MTMHWISEMPSKTAKISESERVTCIFQLTREKASFSTSIAEMERTAAQLRALE
ncbi:hypothetical protein [Actinomadura soli]|uniref:hypothetical protein n=1 Tax=Actinomadura soli TaxID=2508997 RepID=UPI001486C4F9|nr:hypothetical protein [Actinomadura soli]